MLRFLRLVHTWLGILVLPTIIIVGLSGLYLNHPTYLNNWLTASQFEETKFDEWPNPQVVTEAGAKALAIGVFPEDDFQLNKNTRYHDREVFIFDGASGQVIISISTGHYWVKTGFKQHMYDPDGLLITSQTDYAELIGNLHKFGWFNDRLGTWLTDLAAVALVVFGLTGAVMFFIGGASKPSPGQKIMVKRKNTPRPKRIKLNR